MALRGLFLSFKRLLKGCFRRGSQESIQMPLFCPSEGRKRLICFRKKSVRKPWILEFLWRDICDTKVVSRAKDVEFLFADEVGALRDLLDGANAYVLVFDSQLSFLHRQGIPLDRMILYFTHVRAGLPLPGLRDLHAILCLNSFEKALCLHEGVAAERLHIFPAGYSSALFSCSSPMPLVRRRRDVLFVGKYVTADWKGAYPTRKRFSLVCELANALAHIGLNVGILGSSWDLCEYELDPRIEVSSAEHFDYPSYYQDAKIVCCVSSQEGGPVSFLEGLSSGCLMVSTPSGFASEFQSGCSGVWMLPLSAGVGQWVCQIESCLELVRHGHEFTFDGRRDLLERSEFEVLAQQLLNICFL